MRSALWVLLVVVICGAANYFAFDLDRAGSVTFWIIIGLPSVLLAAVGALWMHRRGTLRAKLRLAWGDFASGLSSMLVLFGCAAAASFLLVPSGASNFSWTPGNYVARFYAQLGAPSALAAHPWSLAGALIGIAVADEMIWRGFVTGLLNERFGARGWLYASALYVVATLPSMWSLRDPFTGPSPVLLLAAVGGGLVWGALMRRHRRLVPGMISHALFLWCVVVVFRLWGPSV